MVRPSWWSGSLNSRPAKVQQPFFETCDAAPQRVDHLIVRRLILFRLKHCRGRATTLNDWWREKSKNPNRLFFSATLIICSAAWPCSLQLINSQTDDALISNVRID